MERPQREENLNVVTHAIGTVLSIVAAGLLLIKAAGSDHQILQLASAAYGFSLIGVFLSSTMSHLAVTPVWRQRWRQLDQAFIYLLIVSTYTPFATVFLRSTFWSILLGAMWVLAIVGFVSKLWAAHRVDSVSVLGYVALGWMPILGGTSIFVGVPPGAVWGIIVGGILYTIGTLFLMNDKKIWYFHGIWHLFVMAAAAVHWWTTMVYVFSKQA